MDSPDLINLHKHKSTNHLDHQILTIKADNDKVLLNEIMNYLHNEFHNIEQFSTYELERIITFAGLNKSKTSYLLENYSKEEIMKQIEESDLRSLKKSKSADWSVQNIPLVKREVYIIDFKKSKNEALGENERPWAFISPNVNLIDLKDLLNNFDHYKLIKKAKTIVKDKDNSKLNEFFDKYTDSREKKYRDIFRMNLEDNDLNFLEGDRYMEQEKNKKMKKILSMNMTEKLQKDVFNFPTHFINCNSLIKNSILEFLDIYSIGKFGLVNKNFYKYIFKDGKFNFEKIAKNYALAIFKNSPNQNPIYLNDQEKLKIYKNYFSMLKNRPRIRYSGIYYCKVKFNKLGEPSVNSDQAITTVTYYRIYRFLPTGEIYSITTPNIKSAKIWSFIKKENIDVKSGKFYVDEENNLIIELNAGQGKWNIYKFKVKLF
jgi:hypothetical protein